MKQDLEAIIFESIDSGGSFKDSLPALEKFIIEREKKLTARIERAWNQGWKAAKEDERQNLSDFLHEATGLPASNEELDNFLKKKYKDVKFIKRD